MKHIKLYQTEDAFTAEKTSIEKPWVTLTQDDNEVHYSLEREVQPTFEYVDLDLPSGTLWATCNVGANNPWEYGKYFQWGDTEGYYDNEEHDFSWDSYKWCDGTMTSLTKYNNKSSYGAVDNKTTLDPEDDAVHVHMGGDWRMPTQAQVNELNGFTTQKWVVNYQGTSVNGRLYTSKKDALKSIFIPASGHRRDSSVNYQGSGAALWGSTLFTTSPYEVYHLSHSSSNSVATHNLGRYYGCCVRGVLDAKA